MINEHFTFIIDADDVAPRRRYCDHFVCVCVCVCVGMLENP